MKVAIAGPPLGLVDGQGRLGARGYLVAPLTFGIVRLGESVVKPPR